MGAVQRAPTFFLFLARHPSCLSPVESRSVPRFSRMLGVRQICNCTHTGRVLIGDLDWRVGDKLPRVGDKLPVSLPPVGDTFPPVCLPPVGDTFPPVFLPPVGDKLSPVCLPRVGDTFPPVCLSRVGDTFLPVGFPRVGDTFPPVVLPPVGEKLPPVCLPPVLSPATLCQTLTSDIYRVLLCPRAPVPAFPRCIASPVWPKSEIFGRRISSN
eukprot:3935828-Rhodomonas_salina.6